MIMFGQNVRVQPNGEWIFVKTLSKDEESYLNRTHVKLQEGRWLSRERNYEQAGLVTSEEVIIVGKGPSLDSITRSTFDPSLTVFGINEAAKILKSRGLLNTIVMVQQDKALQSSCRIDGINFVGVPCLPVVPDSYFFALYDIDVPLHSPTVCCAMALAARCGAKRAKMVAFDSCLDEKKVAYAQSVGYPPERSGSPTRFVGYCDLIRQQSSRSQLQIELLQV